MKTKLQTEDSRLLEVSEYGRRRLLTYADSFRELARTMDGSFVISEDQEDRESVLEARHFRDSQQLLCGNLNEMVLSGNYYYYYGGSYYDDSSYCENTSYRTSSSYSYIGFRVALSF